MKNQPLTKNQEFLRLVEAGTWTQLRKAVLSPGTVESLQPRTINLFSEWMIGTAQPFCFSACQQAGVLSEWLSALSRSVSGRALIGALPFDKALGFPRKSNLAQMVAPHVADAIRKGDFSLWKAHGQHPMVAAELFPAVERTQRFHSTFLALLQLSESVPQELYDKALACAIKSPYFSTQAPIGSISENGEFSTKKSPFNIIDEACKNDDSVLLSQLSKIFDPTEYEGARGRGCVDSMIRHGAIHCLDQEQARDPFFIFRPRANADGWRASGATSDLSFHNPLDALGRDFYKITAGGYRRAYPTGDIFFVDEIRSRILGWGLAILPENRSEEWHSFFNWRDQQFQAINKKISTAATWIVDTLNLQPLLCPSAKEFLAAPSQEKNSLLLKPLEGLLGFELRLRQQMLTKHHEEAIAQNEAFSQIDHLAKKTFS